MKIRANKYKKSVKASTDKDYSDLTGMKFDKARDILTKDGFSEHEYGDTKEGNGYAVYRKGDKEVELTYEWVGPMNRAHAGNVIDVYVDEDINTWAYADEAKKYANKSANASVRSNRRAVKASYTYKYAVWVLDGDDNTWKCWSGKDSTDLGMSEDEFLNSINHQTYPNPEYNVDKNYVDVMVIDGDKTPTDYGQTENIKEYGEIAESTRRAVKASEDYSPANADVIAILEANGFEYANEPTPWWDKYMWLGFGATYNDETKEAYVWWNPNGNMVELPFNYRVESVSDANALCDDLYTWDEYDIGELLNAGLPLIGATSHEKRLDEWDYDNGMGDIAYINTTLGSGTVTDAWGETTEYHNLQDLLEAAGIIR